MGYVKDIRAGVQAELRKGTDPFAISSVLKLDKYKDWPGMPISSHSMFFILLLKRQSWDLTQHRYQGRTLSGQIVAVGEAVSGISRLDTEDLTFN